MVTDGKKLKSTNTEPRLDDFADAIINDTYHRNEDIFRFIDTLQAIDGHFAIALDGDWGSGKTSFVKESGLVINYLWSRYHTNANMDWFNWNNETLHDQQKSDLGSKIDNMYPEGTDFNQIGIYYDAWHYDHHWDPLASLIYTISQTIYLSFGADGLEKLELLEASLEEITSELYSPLELPLKLGLGFLRALITGNNDAMIQKIKEKEDLHKKIQEYFQQVSEIFPNTRLVIFIDELDRCAPGFAVRLLEQIKHYCLDDKITFVFVLNESQLQYTIQKYYGSKFDAIRYLEKLFDYKISLPDVGPEFLMKINNLNEDDYYSIVSIGLMKYFNFSIREFDKFNSAMHYLTDDVFEDTEWHEAKNTLLIGRRLFVPVLIALQLVSADKLKQFVSGDGWPILESIVKKDRKFNAVIMASIQNSRPGAYDNSDEKLLSSLRDIYSVMFGGSKSEEYHVRDVVVNSGMKEKILKAAAFPTRNQ